MFDPRSETDLDAVLILEQDLLSPMPENLDTNPTPEINFVQNSGVFVPKIGAATTTCLLNHNTIPLPTGMH